MKNVNIITKRAKRDVAGELRKNGFVNIYGELEVTASKNGKVFHYDKGDNEVTIWAKHATMHLLTGEIFTTHGEQRLFDTDDINAHTAGTNPGEGINVDGTLLSGQQYFSNNTDPNFSLTSRWSRSTIQPSQVEDGDASGEASQVKFPFFPTKMLFGTGFEWNRWADIPSEYQTSYADSDWNSGIFDTNVDETENDYSNIFSGSNLVKARSMNDIFSGSLSTPAVVDTDFGIPGAIKDGMYSSSSDYRGITGYTPAIEAKTFEDGGNEYLVKSWAGVGRPCMIYARRESRFFQAASEVALSSDNNLENKITYTVVMPEQTGADAGIFYPYNGYTLKVAGLFADARMILGNSIPVGGTQEEQQELENYNRMPYGIMYAKRYISPIQKSHDVSISSRWTLYL